MGKPEGTNTPSLIENRQQHMHRKLETEFYNK